MSFHLTFTFFNSAREFPFLHAISSIFDDGHSDWCEVISHCNFNLNFSSNEQCSAGFHVFISHLHAFFREMSVQVFCPFFDWVIFLLLTCKSCLCIFEINPLSYVSFDIIFSHSEDCNFTLFTVCFAVQKFVSLIRFHLFIFGFSFINPGGGSQKVLL